MNILERIEDAALVPVVVIESATDAVATANALLEGGIDVMEITLRTEAALESIELVANQCPRMLVGAGTVTTLETCQAAIRAGAQFIVLPGFNREVVSWCVAHDVVVMPGCVTPTEIMEAIDRGLRVVKFFPANVYGGLVAMKALSGPFPRLRFVPTGGVNEDNIGEYIKAPYVFAVGGSWVCTKKDIAEGRWHEITAYCVAARAKIIAARQR